MIRAHRVSATAQDDVSLVSGWNITPNVAYTLRLIPAVASCGVLLYSEENVLAATGAALAGTEQPCVLVPQDGQIIGMVDADLGWHLLLTTTGTEPQRTIRIGPAVDLPDEIHPVYGDDALALARATAAIDGAAHYLDDVTVTCPLGLGAALGDVVSVPVDGAAVVGQVESATWTATPDGTTEQSVIRRHVAIAPAPFAEPPAPPEVAGDSAETDAITIAAGNVLTNDGEGLSIVAVNGLAANVGQAIAGSEGGVFTVAADGAWTFDPDGDFDLLSGTNTVDTSVAYHASDGVAESGALLTVTVSRYVAPVIDLEFVGSSTAAMTQSAVTLTLPPESQVGDLVLVIINAGCSNAFANPATGISSPSGYTEVFEYYQTGTKRLDLSVNWIVLEEGFSSTITIPGQGSSFLGTVAIAHVWRNPSELVVLEPEYIINGFGSGSSGAPITSGVITPETEGGVVLAIAAAYANSSGSGWTTPVGFENVVTRFHSVYGWVSLHVSSKLWDGSPEIGPLSWGASTITNDCFATALLVLRPKLQAP